MPPAFPPLKHVNAGVLRIGYVEYGPPSGAPVFLMHRFPCAVHAYAEVAPLLADAGWTAPAAWVG